MEPIILSDIFNPLLMSLPRNLGHITGHRSYFLKGAAAMLEHALIRFTVDRLLSRGFRALSVPDLVQPLVFVSILETKKLEVVYDLFLWVQIQLGKKTHLSLLLSLVFHTIFLVSQKGVGSSGFGG